MVSGHTPLSEAQMRRVLLSLCVGLVAAAAASVGFVADSRGSGPDIEGANVFLIPQTDGYGVADCLAGGSECGHIVANAWCESKGYTKAASFGVAAVADITGSTGSRTAVASAPPLLITCAR